MRKAVDYVSRMGSEAIPEFNSPGGEWSWKNTYVFILDENKSAIVANPETPHLIGTNLLDLRDLMGNQFIKNFFEAASKPGGGWVEYYWPKPGEKQPSRKISLLMQVPNTLYRVGAGIYDEKMSLKLLERLL